MRIAIACGGTGGHVFPGMSTANVLLERGHEVTLWLAGRDVEAVSAAGWTGPTVFVQARGLPDGSSPREALALFGFVRSFFSARHKMKKEPPDVLLAMGGYASVAPALAARSIGVPYVLHEANAVPGRAVSLLAGSAEAVALTFGAAAAYVRSRRVIVTGFPLRGDLSGAFDDGELEPGVFTVMVTGGSQGARHLDDVASAGICLLSQRGIPVQVVHLARPEDREWVQQRYADSGVRGPVFGFLQEIGKAYSSADFAVARAGAGTCAELKACRLPALLVPLPSARRNHQMLNAMAMKEAGMADVADQACVNVEWLAEYLAGIIRGRAPIDAMRRAMEADNEPDAAKSLATLVEEAAAQHSP